MGTCKHRSFWLFFLAPAMAGAIVWFVHAPEASAAEITVTTTADEYDTVPNELCSLREAIKTLNDNSSFGGCVTDGTTREINLDGNTYLLTIGGANEDFTATGDLDIKSAMIIKAPADSPATIKGTGLSDRILHVHPGANLTLRYVVIAHGTTPTEGDNLQKSGGGIFNWGTLVLENCKVRDNTAADTGGGIYDNVGVLTVRNSLIHHNTAAIGGGIFVNDRAGGATITDSVISNNSASMMGGGIFNQNENLRIEGVEIRENTATEHGGGIVSGMWGGHATITKSASGTASVIGPGNTSIQSGGGIYAHHSRLTIEEETVVKENTAKWGGGIFNVGSELSLRNSSIVDNNATTGGAGLLSTNPTAGVPLAFSTLESCHVDRNKVVATKGIFPHKGGGITNLARLVVTNCTVNNNENAGNNGGGLYNHSEPNVWALITRSTFAGNKTGATHGYGGAICNDAGNRPDDPGTTDIDESTYPGLILQNSTVSNNEAAEDGGGLANGVTNPAATAGIVNSTFAMNTASRRGGGIYVQRGTVALDSATVAENVADLIDAGGSGGGIFNATDDGSVFLHNTLIAQNSLRESFYNRLMTAGFTGLKSGDCDGKLTSQGYNYIAISGGDAETSCLYIPRGVTGDQNRFISSYTRPQAFDFVTESALQDWGGPTLTLRPITGKGVIDGGDPDNCQPIDQRGEARDHPPCDIGAFETGGECGNGSVETALGETCDDGALNGQPNHCNLICSGTVPSACGNGIMEAGEICDDGAALNGQPAHCNSTCNGAVPAAEVETPTAETPEPQPEAPRETSTPVCGNGVMEAGEICDDGASNSRPGRCNRTCNGTVPTAETTPPPAGGESSTTSEEPVTGGGGGGCALVIGR